MGVAHDFQDLLNISKTMKSFTLPVSKDNYLKIDFRESHEAYIVNQWESPPLPFAESKVFCANVSESRRLTASNESCKDVYEVTFDITGSNILFRPGDTIGIIPQNDDKEINQILSHLELEGQADLEYKLSVNKTIKGSKLPVYVPIQSTLRHVLKHCLDLRSIVKKLFLLALSRYTKDENERRVLEYLSSKEGFVMYTSHILNKNICILDIFAIFQSCKPPAEILFAHLPRLLPRPYSIANSSLRDPNKIKICFSVMDLGNSRKGLITGWLEKYILNNTDLENRIKNLSLNTNENQLMNLKVPIYLRKNISGFFMPKNLETPLLLLGPGTGVAPFLGFLEEREALKEKDLTLKLGETWMFFGCRNADLDFIYEEELNRFLKKDTLTRLTTAFSRVGDGPKYIQDALQQNGKEVTKYITKGASVFICGDLNNMASQIKDVFIQCLITYDGKSKDEAEKYIMDMQKEKRYCVDVWS